MGTISNSPRPNGPIGYVTIGGQRLPVEADPVWWRYWTEQMDASRVLQDGTVTTEKATASMATEVYSAVDIDISGGYGFGRFIVFGVLIPAQRVDCTLSLAATFDASGTVAFDGDRFGALFMTPASNVNSTADNYRNARFVSIPDVQYRSSAPVGSSRTKCALNAPFPIVKGIEYVVGVATTNSIPFTSGLTFYGRGTIEAQVIKV